MNGGQSKPKIVVLAANDIVRRKEEPKKTKAVTVATMQGQVSPCEKGIQDCLIAMQWVTYAPVMHT